MSIWPRAKRCSATGAMSGPARGGRQKATRLQCTRPSRWRRSTKPACNGSTRRTTCLAESRAFLFDYGYQGVPNIRALHVKDPGRRAGETRPCPAQGRRMSYPPTASTTAASTLASPKVSRAPASARPPASRPTTPKVSTRGQEMTLIKSILLGSAAGIVAIAGGTLPGSDTCVRLSGYITAQFVAGNLNTQYNWGTTAEAAALATGLSPGAASALAALSVDARTSQRVLVAASEGQGNSTFYRNAIGWSMSSSFGFDIASNTAYGPLIGHFDFEADLGNGLDPLNGSSSTDSAVFAKARPRKFDGAAEAKLIALTCGPAPEGFARWSLRLLEEKVVELNIVDKASDSTIGRTLKKTSCNRIASNNG